VVWTAAAVASTLVGIAWAEKAVEDARLGLEKTSVFSTPAPIVAKAAGEAPGENESLGAYFSEAPPLVPHVVEDFLPIRAGENLCVDCHMLPDEIGKQAEAGEPTPIPASHYTDLRKDPGKMTGKLIGARFNCTQCHVAQSDAKPLVGNTYRE
jgi:cytochrome c-type protein NapB